MQAHTHTHTRRPRVHASRKLYTLHIFVMLLLMVSWLKLFASKQMVLIYSYTQHTSIVCTNPATSCAPLLGKLQCPRHETHTAHSTRRVLHVCGNQRTHTRAIRANTQPRRILCHGCERDDDDDDDDGGGCVFLARVCACVRVCTPSTLPGISGHGLCMQNCRHTTGMRVCRARNFAYAEMEVVVVWFWK